MGLFFLFVFIILLSSSYQILRADARDRLAAGELISGNQTIVSQGETFALGFFTPENSTADRWYVGIWYHRLPPRTVVWVANRENPLTDPAGVLTVTEDGNIAVLDGAGRTLWSTNLSPVSFSGNTSAVLLDTGNLVLRRGEGGQDVWQSFENPTDTLLPHMNMRSNLRTGVGLRLASWRGAADPSPGQFVYAIDPKTSLQQYIFNGSETYWRGAPWDGKTFLNVKLGNLTTFYARSVIKNDDEIIWTFSVADNSVHARYVLDYTGMFTFYYWEERSRRWEVLGSLPARTCDLYNRCGPFGACIRAQSSCRCLDGFEPRSPEDWKAGNFTAGCVRRRQPQWDGTDRFAKVPRVKLPDGFSVMWNKSDMEDCEAECLGSSRCQAYAFADFSSLNRTGSRCLIWLGEVIDLGQDAFNSEDLYVRLPAPSELGKNKGLIKIVMPIASSVILLMGLCWYFLLKRHKSRVAKRKTREMVLLQGLDFFAGRLGSEMELPDVALLDFNIVKAITSDFYSENKLGEGGFGPVYKGSFLNGQEVAVKRLSKGSNQGYQEFHNEVRLIARLQHNNLVRLLGWCTHKDEKILIYEYMPNGSLEKFIFGSSLLHSLCSTLFTFWWLTLSTIFLLKIVLLFILLHCPFRSDPTRSIELSWEKRFGIIKGIANGLLYLHQHSRMRVIHRDLKTSNILLDSEMRPKISDFGLARIFQSNQDKGNTQKVVGTYGYMSPEYALNGVFSEKSDVFGFGVILLEIITGIRSTGFYPESNSHSLFAYAWQMWEEGRALELLDPSMLSSSSWDTEVLRCTQLAMLCIQEAASDRPTMSSIVSSLSNDTSPLPMPQKPAFVMGRTPNPIQPSSFDRSSKSSTNELTRSSVMGR
ncbi:hypothetical protein Taro_056589, partial [Colocasia esculenta]|nr:hypothetical protein [Colocasia esculenta]